MTRHERCAKAGGEGCLGLCHPLLRAGDLGRVAGQEVVHRLLRRQSCNRRHDTEGIGRQHDDRRRMTRLAAVGCVRNEVQRIGAASVFGSRAIVEVRHAVLIEHDIFEHGAEALGRRVDLRLGFGGQADGLGIAAAFKVEDAGLAPAMLVIADQGAGRIGRKRRLAGAGQAEKDGRVTIGSGIGRAMHRHDALLRQKIVERGEDGLLHLAGIGGAADQDQAVLEVAGDHGLGPAAVALGVRLEAWQVDDRQLRQEALERTMIRADQQIADEQRVPGKLGHDPGRQCIVAIGAADQILDEEVHACGMGQHVLAQQVEMAGGHRLVVVPPDLTFRHLVADHEFVLRGPSGMLSGIGTQRSICGQHSLAATDRFFVQLVRGQVIVDASSISQTDFGDPVVGIEQADLLHHPFSFTVRRG